MRDALPLTPSGIVTICTQPLTLLFRAGRNGKAEAFVASSYVEKKEGMNSAGETHNGRLRNMQFVAHVSFHVLLIWVAWIYFFGSPVVSRPNS